MKQQWLLLLATVGMSLGALASQCSTDYCGNCYGYTDTGASTLASTTVSNTDGCTQDDYSAACADTVYQYYNNGGDNPTAACGTATDYYVSYKSCNTEVATCTSNANEYYCFGCVE